MTEDENVAPGNEFSAQSAPEGWHTDRPDDADALDTLWIRWTDGGSDIHFHRTCEIFPRVTLKESWPYLGVLPEGERRPYFEPVQADGDGPNDQQEQFKFVSGLPRQALRHTPLVIFLSTVILFAGAEFTSDVDGLSALFPTVSRTNVLLLGMLVSSVPLLIWLFATVDMVENDELPEAIGVYGLIAFLGASVIVTLFLVVTADHPSDVEANVVWTSGYLLTLLLGGMLLYEGILRIEHLFVRLGEREQDIVENSDAYRRFLTDLNHALTGKRVLGVHPSRLFGILFAGQFLVVWLIGGGPQSLNYPLGIGVNFALNVLLVTIVFEFFILVRYFNKLMNETREYGDVRLHYEPFHIDGYGGFRDFGRFATRINILLTLAGLYLVYRLYIEGGRGLPTEGFAGFADPILSTVWLINFVGPVLAYALGIAAWGYYSFWAMHVKMERDKQMLARKYQGQRGDWELDRTPSAGDTIDSFEDCAGPEWGAFRSAPTWPLNVNTMASLLSSNLIPLLIPVANLLL